jgi:ABC-type multidrug transport system fused ATPase/permease subunit
MVALFRMVELGGGIIKIDGTDVANVPLQVLRSKLAIIPQDPVLLTGTIRFQLDPFGTYTNEQVWQVLEQVNMREAVESFAGGLSEPVRENGENLSQGQRQLICIARALLRRTPILIVDEGTSAVDPYTDDLVQRVLREQARVHGTTILAIAHRLQTILDFDKILVMGAGKVLEYDTPTALLAKDTNSVFASMLEEANH